MQTQAFHVDYFQPGFAHPRHRQRQVRQLAVGKHVAIDEVAGPLAHRAAVGVARGDAVVHHQAAGTHRIVELLEVQPQVGVPDVLEHADADHLVEATIARQVAVVQQLEGDPVLQAFGLDPLPPERQLLLAQCDASDLDAELASGQARQAPPAATDIEQLLARLQSQLATQVAELGQLRSGEVFLAGLEIGAGIDHFRIQPELVEVVGQVVVVMDGFGVGDLVVAFANRRRGAIGSAERFAEGIADTDDLADRSFDVETLLDVGLAQRIEAGMGDLG